MAAALACSAAVIISAMSALWLRQRATRNATSVDVAWALGTGAQAVLLAVVSPGDPVRRAVIAVLAAAWALRLGGHLYFDRVRGGVEDGRYARFRREWSQAAFFGFYMAQAALIFLLPLTFLGALGNPAPFPAAGDGLGLAVWGISWAGEFAADRQLAAFKSDPAHRGKTCRAGLWRYSRHPNYFFEWLTWCSYVPLSWGSRWAFLSLAGPALLLFLLFKVSGIPPTEAQALASRGDDYREYQRTTSAFFPWFPKKEAAI